MTRDEVIAAARSTLGVPFVHQGRSLRGLDCIGMLLHVADQFGIVYDDVQGYSRVPSSGLLEAALEAHVSNGVLRRVDEMTAADILLMRFKTDPQHVAVCTPETLIHSYSSVGKVVEHRLDSAWASRIVRIYRFAGVSA